ncbi:Nucleotide-diphospho-sugar transferase family protein [Rhynchospora pubera]|uniref:Nucleotide-diphospho-sugar transferase family protein n=1 Tax=Rhynchospora pubera TaxID=906938 RepID=A0AAV8GJ48_9POAL|nr:Nucleotide-diphospho-sugar transferase family protein [Rhynchospora pubera]
MKILNHFQVQLPWFCLGGFVGALLVLSVRYTEFGNNRLPEVQPEECVSPTLAIENDIPVKKPDQDPLAEILKSAAIDGNMVILTQGNEAWMAPNSLFDLFLEGFRVGEEIEHLLNHLVVVTVDQKGFEKCKTVHKYCYLMKTEENFSDEKFYMSKGYLDLMWIRNKFQRRILELGYNFLFTDMDILWFRNPLRCIAITSDMAFASDVFFGDEDKIEPSAPNGGFMYVKSSNKTIEFFKNWQDQRVNYPDQHDQDVLNKVKVEFSKRFQVKMQFMNTVYTAGFCEMSKDISKVCTVHANCCVGLQAKLLDLRSILGDWKAYKSIPPWTKEKETFKFRDHVYIDCAPTAPIQQCALRVAATHKPHTHSHITFMVVHLQLSHGYTEHPWPHNSQHDQNRTSTVTWAAHPSQAHRTSGAHPR